jgi:hypothetical protein
MADPLIIGLLTDKRARLAGQIADLERQLAELRTSVMHLDATLLLFDPSATPATILPIGVRKGGLFDAGDITGMCMACVRESTDPISSREIALRLMRTKGMNMADKRLRHVVQSSVRNALLAYKRRGVLERIGTGWETRWRLRGSA